MKLAALVAVFSVSIPLAAAAQGARGQRPAATTASPDKVADAYAQFMLGHRFEENEDETSAIAAYKRAMELDPKKGLYPLGLGSLYMQAADWLDTNKVAPLPQSLQGIFRIKLR